MSVAFGAIAAGHPLLAVGAVAAADELGDAADTHGGEADVPGLDHAARAELEVEPVLGAVGLPARGVEEVAVLEAALIVDEDRLARASQRASPLAELRLETAAVARDVHLRAPCRQLVDVNPQLMAAVASRDHLADV